jgi:signal transduction histidine kinase
MLGNRGIFRVSRRELNEFAAGRNQRIVCVVYDAADGMTPSEGNGGRQPAGWRMRDGRIWFPTIGGMAIVDPRETSPSPPPVLIEQAVLNGQPLDLRQPLKIAHDQENLEIHYTGLSFGKPEMVRFSYQLAGLDKEWIDSGTRRIAYYPHLPPGDYTFRVKAISPDGVWSVREAGLTITVQPPFWLTVWFFSFVVISGVGLALAGYRWRVAQYRRRTAEQEAFARQLIDSQERERQRIAAELHDGLSQSLVIIRRRALVCLEASDDQERTREHLQEIAEATRQALEEVREAVFDLHPQQLDRLGLTGAVSDLLDRVAGAQGWQLTKRLDELDGLLTKEAENSLYRIVQESINNISKHARATTVAVTVSRKPDQIELAIEDNGVGFAAEIGGVLQTGFGLQGIVERARLLGGQVFIESLPGKGTGIRLRLPLKDASYET